MTDCRLHHPGCSIAAGKLPFLQIFQYKSGNSIAGYQSTITLNHLTPSHQQTHNVYHRPQTILTTPTTHGSYKRHARMTQEKTIKSASPRRPVPNHRRSASRRSGTPASLGPRRFWDRSHDVRARCH